MKVAAVKTIIIHSQSKGLSSFVYSDEPSVTLVCV